MESTVSTPQELAQTRIKNHIKRCGKNEVHLTERMVRNWWRTLNTAVFDGVVHEPTSVRLVKHRKEFAWALSNSNGTVRISIQPTFDSRIRFLMVLVHEMVHAWEHQIHGAMSHGPTFKKWSKPIKESTGLKLKSQIMEKHEYTIT